MSLQDYALLRFSCYSLPLNNNRTIKQYVVHSDNQIDIKTNKTKNQIIRPPAQAPLAETLHIGPGWQRPDKDFE